MTTMETNPGTDTSATMVSGSTLFPATTAEVPTTTTANKDAPGIGGAPGNVLTTANVKDAWVKDKDCKLYWGKNPHKEGTEVFNKFGKTKESGKVGDAKEKGATAWDLCEWVRKGSLKYIENSEEEPSVEDKVSKLETTKRLLQSPSGRAKTNVAMSDSPGIEEPLFKKERVANSDKFENVGAFPTMGNNNTPGSASGINATTATPKLPGQDNNPPGAELKNDKPHPLLAVITALTQKNDHLTNNSATQNDILQLATKADVTIMISEAVDQVKNEMTDLRNEIETLTKRIQTVESAGASKGPQTGAKEPRTRL